MRILISVSGGVVQSVSTDADENVEVEIFDWDDVDHNPKSENFAAFVAATHGMHEVY